MEVPVCQIEDIYPHPNADRLEFAKVLGWDCVVPKGKYQVGDEIIYFPIESVIPDDVAETIGVKGYLKNGRVRALNLRGWKSFGVVADKFIDAPLGTDLMEQLGVVEYEPPSPRSIGGLNQGKPIHNKHPMLEFYHKIERLQNYKNSFVQGEEVIATEKVHGTNCCHGLVNTGFIASSRKTQRENENSLYWQTFDDKTKDMLEWIKAEQDASSVLVYKEVFGGNVQGRKFGYDREEPDDVVFDIMIDGDFIDWDDVVYYCMMFKIPHVPVLYRGPYSLETLKTLVNEEHPLTEIGNGKHIIEGVVVKPVHDRIRPNGKRLVMKLHSDEYLVSH